MSTDRDYMREYAYQKYQLLREKMESILGGKCAVCGTTQDLHMDHINPAEKKYELSQLVFRKYETFLLEVSKCQLLCDIHHRAKHAWKHGTLAGYRHCKCTECRAVKSAWSKQYNLKRRGNLA